VQLGGNIEQQNVEAAGRESVDWLKQRSSSMISTRDCQGRSKKGGETGPRLDFGLFVVHKTFV
jgi:hypothetical protein